MPFELEHLPGENILIATLVPPVDITADADGTIHLIADVSQDTLSFHEVIMGLATSIDCMVGAGEMIQLAAASFEQEHYGARGRLPVFTGLDEALATVHNW